MGALDAFRAEFQTGAVSDRFSAELKSASLESRLGRWTELITACSAEACIRLGWIATAKGFANSELPVRRSEYLGLDLTAFGHGRKGWPFPSAVMEFENSNRQDQIAYSLWKVLCVRAHLRVVFCYRKEAKEAADLVRGLTDAVIEPLDLEGRLALEGETAIVVGSRSDALTFPYGFFSWWSLDANTGRFNKV